MSNQQKILLLILAVCGGLYFLMPPTGYQAEIANRKKITPQQANEQMAEYALKAANAVKERELREKRAREEAEKAKVVQQQDAAAKAARYQAEFERNQALQRQLRAQSVPASTTAPGIPTAYTNGSPATSASNGQRNVAAVPPNLVQQQVRQAMQQQQSASQQEGLATTLNQPSSPQVTISRTAFATRFLYLRLKGRVLRFDVAKDISEPQLDAMVKVLSNVCISTDKTSAKCRTNLIVDRGFYLAANQTGEEASTHGWNLECVGALTECLSASSKSIRFSLSENPQTGTKLVARGFVNQAVGAKQQPKLTPTSALVIDKVYVTRMAAR